MRSKHFGVYLNITMIHKALIIILVSVVIAVSTFYIVNLLNNRFLGSPLVFKPDIVDASFQIRPPKKWTEDKTLSSKNKRYIASFASETKKSSEAGVNAYTYSAHMDVVVIEPTKETDLNSVVLKYKNLTQKASLNTTFLKDEVLVINNEKGQLIEFINSSSQEDIENAAKALGKKNEDTKWHENQKSHSIYVFFIHKGYLYFVSGIALENHWSEFKNEITDSIKSFKFLN